MRSMLSREQATFLNIIKSALLGKRYDLAALQGETPGAGFDKIFELARIHKLTSLVCDTVYQTPGIREARSYLESEKEAIRAAAGQAIRSAQFEDLYLFLSQKGLRPVVVKGITIRQLYPRPCYRESVDEDLWIEDSCKEAYHKAFTEYGLVADLSDAWVKEEVHASYIHPSTSLTIDVHVYSAHSTPKKAGEPGNLIWYLGDAFERTTDITINGTVYRTLGYTDHLFYLILHALKHFMYSGFGIRQVCDIILFSEYNRSSIDWVLLTEKLKAAHAYEFTIAICKIGTRYFLKAPNLKSCVLFGAHIIPGKDSSQKEDVWNSIDEMPLLRDVLEGGLYGNASLSRLHSSNITLHAMSDAAGNGRKTYSAFQLTRNSVFLPLQNMKGRYHYLEKAPFLLPVAWMQRGIHYLLELNSVNRNKSSAKQNDGRTNSAVESLRIGQERIRLLQQYHIIE